MFLSFSYGPFFFKDVTSLCDIHVYVSITTIHPVLSTNRDDFKREDIPISIESSPCDI